MWYVIKMVYYQKDFLTSKWVKLIEKKDVTKTAFELDYNKTFIIYIATLTCLNLSAEV